MWMPAKIAPLQSRLIAAWQRRALTLKAASFAVIGILNTLIDLGVFLAAYSVFNVMNCFITFAAESGRVLRWRAYGAFVLSGVAGVIANTTTLVVASYWMPVLEAKLLAIAASFVVNFSLSHLVVFMTKERRTGTSPE